MPRDQYSDVGHIPLRTYDPSDTYSQQTAGKPLQQQSRIDDTVIEQDLLDLEAYCQRPVHRVFGVDVTAITARLPSSIRVTNGCLNKTVGWGAACVALLLIIAIISSMSSSPEEKTFVDASGGNLCAWNSVYLPSSVAPDSYDLKLQIDLKSVEVTGSVGIKLNVSSATKCVVLHADSLHITAASLQHSGKHVPGRVSKPNSDLQQVTVHFKEGLQASAGNYTMQLEFKYPLQDGVDGLYRSSFQDASGNDSFLAVSQFESIAARKAFPCFDETRFKAKFRVTLETPPAVALSNMPKFQETQMEGGMVRHEFYETPYMSPYLLAFLVGNLTNNTVVCSTKEGDKMISAWGTYNRQAQLATAGRVACAAIKKMENMTGVAYALPKLDLAAIPDFAAGAMENWGLITYKESDILVDVLGDDVEQRFQVAATIAHELAHQWFGNLVTASDWTELWLNEGFATYFENVGGNAYESQYRYFDFFYESITSLALNDDAMSSSHPLTMSPIKSLGQIDNLFDSIMYEKGGAVLRMLRAYLNRDRMSDTGGQLRRRLLARLLAANTTATNKAAPASTPAAPTAPAASSTAGTASAASTTPGTTVTQVAAAPATAAQNVTTKADAGAEDTGAEDTGAEDPGTEDAGSGDDVPEEDETGDGQDEGGDEPVDDNTETDGSDEFGDEDDERTPHDFSDDEDDEEEDPNFRVEDPSTDSFLKGLAEYLKRRQYNVSTYKDLWGSMEFAIGEPVTEWMSTWTLRKNYPLVTLLVGENGELAAKQEPFTTDTDAPQAKGAAPILPVQCDEKQALGTWWVPLAWRMQKGEGTINWHPFSTCNTSLGTQLDKSQGGYVLLNSGRFGFYRVNYPKEIWDALATAAHLDSNDPGYIDDMDFSGLLDDSFRLSEAGALDITVFMQLASALGRRTQAWAYSPWSLAAKQLHKVRLLLAAAEGDKLKENNCLGELQQWMLGNVTGPYIANTMLPGKNQGFSFNITPNEPVSVRRLRPLLLSTAAEFGDSSQLEAAVQLLQAITARGKDAVHPDLHNVVYQLAVLSGKEEAFDMVLELYKKETDAEEKRRLMMALTYAPTAPLITRALKLAASPDIRLADMGKFIASLGQQGRLAFTMTWDYILANTHTFLKRYPGGGAGTEAAYSFGRPLKDLGALFVDDAWLPKLRKWAKKYRNILDPKFIPYVEENVRQNGKWLRKQGAGVCSWLKDQKR